jgi:hypothetical protein
MAAFAVAPPCRARCPCDDAEVARARERPASRDGRSVIETATAFGLDREFSLLARGLDKIV